MRFNCSNKMTQDYQSDESLVLKTQAGEIDSFGILVSRYETKIQRYLRRFLQKPDDIDDTVQEVFTKAFVNIQSFDTSKKFSSWIYRIAHNEMVNLLKKNRLRFTLPILSWDTILPQGKHQAQEQIHDELERKEIKRMIELSINELKDIYKEPLVLHYLEDLSYKEISDILRLPVATVGVRINRAKALLKNNLKQQGHGTKP